MLLNEETNGLKITDMTKTSNLEGIEYIPVVQDNFNKKIDVNDMKVALDIPKLSSDLNQSNTSIAASTKATNDLLSLLNTLGSQIGTISSQIETINQRLISIEGGNISLNWNNITGKPSDEELRGPQGVQGLQGIQGINGPQGPQGSSGLNGADGKDGVDGLPGEDGSTSYFHIKYSANSDGNPMQDTPAKYIGTIVTQYINPPTNYLVYTWYDWKGAQGPNGNQGIPGVNGVDGKTSYLHIKYGIGYDENNVMIFTGAAGEDVGPWVGMYTDHELIDSTNPSMYKWSYQKGADGKDGTAYEYIFKLTSTLTRPSTPTTSQVDDYVPDGWTDDPTDVTESTPYLWACIRTKVNNIWGNFSTPALWAKWSKDGEDGVTPDWISFVFKQSSTQPTTPTGTAVVPSGWLDAPTGTGVWWMSKATISGPTGLAGAWSVPVKVTGADGTTGSNGTDGSYVVYQFAKNTSLTTAPTTGWASTPPTLSTGEYCWMRNGTVVPPASTPASWSTGVRISGEKGDKGDAGDTGAAGPLPLFLGVYNSSTTYTGTNSVINIVKWNNGVDDFYYKTKVTAGTFSNIAPSNTLYWEAFPGQFSAIATELLVAEGANIGGWIFHNDGTNDLLKSQNDSAILNGTTGAISVADSKIVFNQDGSGYLANNRFFWNSLGELFILANQPYGIKIHAPAPSDPFPYVNIHAGGIEMKQADSGGNNSYTSNSGVSVASSTCQFAAFVGNPDGKLKLNFKNLPQSSSDLVDGDVWNDNGTLKIIVS